MTFLRTADLSDIPLIASLADTIWKKHYPTIIGMPQVEYMLQKMYSGEALAKQMKEGQVFHLVFNSEIPVGFVSVSEKVDDHLFLHKFYLSQAEQGRGMGTKVFSQLLDQYPEAKTVELTVNRQNYTSINFYFKLGFKIEKVADFDIGDGYVMNDFIMKMKISR